MPGLLNIQGAHLKEFCPQEPNNFCPSADIFVVKVYRLASLD
jgi:hypothetical protein